MAILQVKQVGAGVSGGVAGKEAHKAKRSYSAAWQVKCSDGFDTGAAIIEFFRRHRDLPYIGRAYSFGGDRDPSSVCNALDCNLIQNSGGIWSITARYEPPEGKDEDEGQDEDGNKSSDPLAWRDEIDVSYSQIAVPAEGAIFHGSNAGGRSGTEMRVRKKGQYGPIVNSAGVPFDPGIEEEINLKIVRFSRNVAEFDGDEANGWIGAVNTRQVRINKRAYRYKDSWGPLTARIKNIGGSFQVANGTAFWKKTIEVHVNPLGWRKFLVDRGTDRRQMPGDPKGDGDFISYNDLKKGDPQHAKITGPDGYPITSPVLLDGEGQPLAADGEPVYLEYQLCFERSFAGIRW